LPAQSDTTSPPARSNARVGTTTITRTVTVAAGVFAPGHLGELTRYLPFELVDDVLAETRTVQRRLRELPSRTGVYFVLALGLFPRLGYARVWAKLCAGLAGLAAPVVSEKALRDLRRRLGPRSRRFGASSILIRLKSGHEQHLDLVMVDHFEQIILETRPELRLRDSARLNERVLTLTPILSRELHENYLWRFARRERWPRLGVRISVIWASMQTLVSVVGALVGLIR
jgi:hypothetical protein